MELPLKCSDLVNAVTTCPACSEQCPRQLPEESGATQLSSQLERDWQIAYTVPLSVSEGSIYALVCVDPVSGLTQALPCHCTNQGVTIRGL